MRGGKIGDGIHNDNYIFANPGLSALKIYQGEEDILIPGLCVINDLYFSFILSEIPRTYFFTNF